jgi:glucose/arabinose dehydrogenase
MMLNSLYVSLRIGVALGILLIAGSTVAQESQDKAPPATRAEKPAPNIQPAPTTVPGRPDIPNAEVAKTLRGVPAPPFPAPVDKLPVTQLKLPKGFKIDVYASGIANARSLRIGDKGTVFVSNRQLDKVYAIFERSGKRETKVIASGLDRPNGLAYRNGTLYIGEGTKFRNSKRSKSKLIARLNPWSFTMTCPITSRTAGSSSPSALTISSTSMSARRAISVFRPRRTRRSAALIWTAAAPRYLPGACVTLSASTGTL